jgi:hypothetical protein
VPSFRDWWAEFISTRVGVRPSTRLRDESIFRCHLEPFFGNVPIDQIGFRDAQRFVAELAATDLAPRTVRKAAGLLAQSLDIAVRSRSPAPNACSPRALHVWDGTVGFVIPTYANTALARPLRDGAESITVQLHVRYQACDAMAHMQRLFRRKMDRNADQG